MISRALLSALACICLTNACGAQDPPMQQRPRGTATERFWDVVESARLEGRTCAGTTAALERLLQAAPINQVIEFSTELNSRMAESWRWDLWAVAYMANGGASDDGFGYFRGWLISRGKQRYDLALLDPPAAVDGAPAIGALECEGLLYVPRDVYLQRERRELPDSTRVRYGSSPAGSSWNEETLDDAYPGWADRIRRSRRPG